MSEEPKPIQVIRDSQICVSYTVRSALNYVSQARGETGPDAIAEYVLKGWLHENHPDVMEHIKSKHDADKLFRAELKKKLGTPVPFENP